MSSSVTPPRRGTHARTPRWLAMALSSALLLLSAQTVRGYVRTTTNKSGKPVSWWNSNCILVRVSAKGSDDLSDGSDVAAVKQATRNWHAAVEQCSYLRFVFEEPDSPDPQVGHSLERPNENVIVWVEEGWEHELDAAGITTVTFVDAPGSTLDGQILDADMELNGEFFTFATNGDRRSADVESTVTHELGHMMGLDHPCDDGARVPLPKDDTGTPIPNCEVVKKSMDPAHVAMRETTMYNFAEPGETKMRSPEADDIRAVCEIYPIADDPGECVPAILETGTRTGGCDVSSGPSARIPLPLLLTLALAGAIVGVLRRVRRRRGRRPAP